jgi:hypothetical protein
VTPHVRLENNASTFHRLLQATPLQGTLDDASGYTEKTSDRRHGVTTFDLVFHHIVLFVPVKVTLTNVGPTRRRCDEKHDFVIARLTPFVGIHHVDLSRIVSEHLFRDSATVGVRMSVVGVTGSITWCRLFTPVVFEIMERIGHAVVVAYTNI